MRLVMIWILEMLRVKYHPLHVGLWLCGLTLPYGVLQLRSFVNLFFFLCSLFYMLYFIQWDSCGCDHRRLILQVAALFTPPAARASLTIHPMLSGPAPISAQLSFHSHWCISSSSTVTCYLWLMKTKMDRPSSDCWMLSTYASVVF